MVYFMVYYIVYFMMDDLISHISGTKLCIANKKRYAFDFIVYFIFFAKLIMRLYFEKSRYF